MQNNREIVYVSLEINGKKWLFGAQLSAWFLSYPLPYVKGQRQMEGCNTSSVVCLVTRDAVIRTWNSNLGTQVWTYALPLLGQSSVVTQWRDWEQDPDLPWPIYGITLLPFHPLLHQIKLFKAKRLFLYHWVLTHLEAVAIIDVPQTGKKKKDLENFKTTVIQWARCYKISQREFWN